MLQRAKLSAKCGSGKVCEHAFSLSESVVTAPPDAPIFLLYRRPSVKVVLIIVPPTQKQPIC